MTDIHHDGPCPSPASSPAFPPSSYLEEGGPSVFSETAEPSSAEVDQLFSVADLAHLDDLLDWLGVIEDAEDADMTPWREALNRVVVLAARVNEVLPSELEYLNALELSVLRNVMAKPSLESAPGGLLPGES